MTDSDGEGDWSASEDGGWAVEINLKEKAKWKFEKECRLYAPQHPDLSTPTEQIGMIKVKCKGKYKKKVEITQIHTTDEEGNPVERENREEEITLKVKSFHYKMELQGEKYDLKLKKTGGHFAWNNLKWKCEKKDTEEECFEVIGDGRNATVTTTGAGGDCTAMLLGAFAVSCKFDPEEIEGYAKDNCNRCCSI